jgi:hypothetical protein
VIAGQVLLACFFVMVGYSHALMSFDQIAQQARWLNDVPRWLNLLIGDAEIAGGLGLIIPAATRKVDARVWRQPPPTLLHRVLRSRQGDRHCSWMSRHTKAMGVTVVVRQEELGLPIVSLYNLRYRVPKPYQPLPCLVDVRGGPVEPDAFITVRRQQ